MSKLLTPVISTSLEKIVEDRFGKYSKYIIQERALPDVRDGLKPVQRRILYTMHSEGNIYSRQTRKSAKTVGTVMGNYHPHGDSSIYEAMVRLSQEWKMREPLIDMQGNNGSIDDDPAAAMRYTEARLSKISDVLLSDIDKDTVDFVPNFDDTETEPTVLPTRFPNLLVNGSTGIAAGYATNIAPHNLKEVIEATIYRIKTPNSNLEGVMQFIKGPDFPTGGIVQGKEGIIDAFSTGKGRVVVRGKCEIIKQRTLQQIVVTEIPYEVVKSKLVMKLDDIRLSKDISGIIDVRDESDRNGMKIVVDINKDADASTILNYLYKNTDLQVYFSYNMVGIINKRPAQVGLLELIDAFIAYREEVITRRSEYELKIKEDRCHILEGLVNAISVLDEVIQIIRESKDKKNAKERLSSRFEFTERQAEAIVNLRLYRLTNTDIVELAEEMSKLRIEIDVIKSILTSKRILHNLIIRELREVADDYGSSRLTEIHDEVEEITIDHTSMINNEQVMFTVSRDGYLKRVAMRSYKATPDSETGLKDFDKLIGQVELDLVDNVLVFTNKGNYAYLPVYKVNEHKWKDIGTHITKYAKMQDEEKIVDAAVIKNIEAEAWIISVTKNGLIKRTLVSEWEVQRTSRTYTAINLAGNDEVVRTLVAYENDEIALISETGKVVRYSVMDISNYSTRSKGVLSMRLDKEDSVVGATIINSRNNNLVVLTDNSQIKRIKADEIPMTKIPSRGKLVAKKVASNPKLIRYIVAGHIADEFQVSSNTVEAFKFKDVVLSKTDSLFSSAIIDSEDWMGVNGIPSIAASEKPDEVVEPEKEEIAIGFPI